MMLHNCLDRAVKEHLISRNPTEECIIPKIQRKEMKILHPDNIHVYLKAAEARGVLPLFYLELTSGVRLAAVGWLQSFVSDPTQRETLFDLSVTRSRLAAAGIAREELLKLDKSISNLLRMWAR